LKDFDQVALWRSDVFTLMDQRSEFPTVLVPLEGDQRVGMEDRFESSTWFAGLIAELGEVLEVLGDVALVPGDQDRFNT
jgi:hypothetical protein